MFSAIIGFFSHAAMISLLTSPWVWGLLIVVLLAAGFYLAPTQTLKVLTNWRTYAVGGIAALAITCVHLELKTQKLQTDLTTFQASAQTKTDGQQAVDVKKDAQVVNAKQVGKLHTIVASSPKGTKLDAVLDQIQADDAASSVAPPKASAPGVPVSGDATDRLLDGYATARP